MPDGVSIEEDLCLWNLIKLRGPDRCQYVLENCKVSSQVNYYHIYFCSINESNLIFLPITILSSYICFWAIGSTADAYLSPVLASISEHLRLS